MLLVFLSFKEVPFSISITCTGLSQKPSRSYLLLRFDLMLDVYPWSNLLLIPKLSGKSPWLWFFFLSFLILSTSLVRLSNKLNLLLSDYIEFFPCLKVYFTLGAGDTPINFFIFVGSFLSSSKANDNLTVFSILVGPLNLI